MPDRNGQQVGNYRLVRLLGAGGFAEVYLGAHVHLGSQAAIKLLTTHFATPAELEKFRAEARTLATLQHPNIVRLLDFGVEEGTPYLVMDYAPNGSLRQRLPTETPLLPSTILPFLVQVAEALQYAHERQLVHRDVKPENMLLGRSHEVLLSDFGIATVAQHTSQQRTEGVAGTAAYMAPEQLQGKPRPSSDLYALGVVVYEWLCGERPFQGGPMEVATQQVLTPPPPLREKVPDLPAAIEHVVLTALAKDPKERFGNVRAFVTAFQQACREAGMVYVTSRPPLLPLAPAQQPPALQADQGSVPASSAQAPAGTAPDGQADQAGAAIISTTTHLTPQLIPPSGHPQTPEQVGREGSSRSQASTRLFTPDPTLVAPSPDTPVADSRAAGTEAPAAQRDEPPLVARPLAPDAHGGKVATRRHTGRLWRWGLVAAACLVVLALFGSGTVYGLPLLLHAGSTTLSSQTAVLAATSATVTITPARSDLKNTFPITGVTGAPDASKSQVQARQLSVTTSAQSNTVNATGSQTIPGIHATGTLSFAITYIAVNGAYTIAAGTTYTGASGVTVETNSAVDLNTGATTITVPAHAVNPGATGNIPALDINVSVQQGCFSVCAVKYTVTNPTAFTGGKDASTSSVVQQSDIDNAANTLIQANQPNAQQVLQGQLQQGEQLIGTPQCSPNVSADHHAGDQASQVTVTVSFTCTGEAYDQAGALMLAKQLLTGQAATTPGAGYALVGQIKTTLVSAMPDNQEVVAIVVQAEGIWVYQFSTTQEQALAQLIAGKSQQEAEPLLAVQPGVAQVQIHLTGGNGQTLPTDPQQITILIQAVPGL